MSVDTITPTTWTLASVTPTSVDTQWLPYKYFKHDWANPLSLYTSYLTSPVESASGLERRRGLSSRPSRAMDVVLYNGKSTADCLDMQDLLQRLSISGMPMPLYCDQTETTASSSFTTIYCDTTYRRFYVGGRIVIVNKDGSYEVANISSITDTSIVLVSNLSETKAAGLLVFPLMETKAVLETVGNLYTDRKATVAVTFLEEVGKQAIPASSDIYTTKPTFSFPFNWRNPPTFGSIRLGDSTTVGLREKQYVAGVRGKNVATGVCTFNSRDSFWGFLEFFDSVRGDTYTFLMPSPAEEYTYVSHSTSVVAVEINGHEADWSRRPYIAVHTKDNVYVREINTVTRGTYDSISLKVALPTIASGDITKVTLAYNARFNTGEMIETWYTDSNVEVLVDVVEVIDEKDTTITIETLV